MVKHNASDRMHSNFSDRSGDNNASSSPSDGVSPFTFLSPDEIIDEDRVTAVLLVPFTESREQIITIEHYKRGIDIPSGHVEPEDSSFHETARRELKEETGAEIGQVTPIIIMESHGYDNQDTPSYMVVLAGIVRNEDIGAFEQSPEILSRQFMTPDEFLDEYGGAHVDDMRIILNHARAMIGHNKGHTPGMESY